MATLLCIGEILVEMVAEQVDQSRREPGHWIGPFPSGAPAILADQAALCGADVSIVGTVGADEFGEACLARLRASGVGLDHVRVDEDGTTGVAFVRYSSTGSRSFIFHVAETASGRFRLDDLDAGLDGVDCVHVMGSSAFSAAAVDAIAEVVDGAAARGIRVSFDPNLRREMLTHEEYVTALRRFLGAAQIVLASEGELQALLGEESDAACAARLTAGAAEVVVLKRGANGASLFLPGHGESSVPGLLVDTVDPTGAGDCFGGTFLALYLGGTDASEALRYANVAGALAVGQRGPMSGNRSLAELRAAAPRLRSRT
ncbi:sugar kinase [Cellulomonas sp. P24]|uniref:sugar kinase n=1 Tax=Cellulomonas sp. P24 TaxID=2885206 RepID=UPI00216AFA52|nr:sugar kinase [Cellulomonas sp. P24]MCR6491990.1 sugar kinase [Cellulomonas sp. P24]